MLRILNILFLLIIVQSVQAKADVLQDERLSDIHPQGWLYEMLNCQQKNFTEVIGSTIYPFSQGGWGTTPFTRIKHGKPEIFWVPYEQTAYYYDGMIRCGYLLGSHSLISKSQKAINNTIKTASKDGVILAELSKGEMRRWPHAVFFRSLMAEYENTHDKNILNALCRHYNNDTITYKGRDLCNIEILAWLFKHTNDATYKNKALNLLNAEFETNETLQQFIENMAAPTPTEIHAVTFHEMLKIPAILYSLTGDKSYLDKAQKIYDKIDHYNMLPDGVCSGEEGLSGNNSTNCHEMCNIVDYMWSTIYMLRATQDVTYADRVEAALFNAGLGGITKNFDAHQYYSTPNQVVCDNHSSNVSVYDDSRLAYRQAHRPQCCTGNINRMLPIYIGAQWMTDSAGTIYKMLFGPGSIDLQSKGKSFTLCEKSSYPFGDTIKIIVEKGNGIINMNIRVPQWAYQPKAYINNREIKNIVSGEYIKIRDTKFSINDSITLIYKKKPILKRWNDESMTIFYGSLLMALPISSNTTCDSIYTPKLQANKYMGYRMIPASDWNYIIGEKDENDNNISVSEIPIDINSNPWTMQSSPLSIRVPAYKTDSWQIAYKKMDNNYYEITPNVPPRGSMIYALNGLKPQAISLVPYGRTTLRVSMFPFWRAGNIPAEVLATDNK